MVRKSARLAYSEPSGVPVSVAAQAFLRSVSKLVGSEVLEDALRFFTAFEGMEAGFKERAAKVQALLADPGTAYLLVASPRQDTVAEAAWFAERLRSSHLPVEALVVNRVHPRFDEGSAEADRLRAETLAGTPLGALYSNLADFRTMAEGEEAHLVGLSAAVEPAPVLRVPFLADDVHDVDTLEQVAGHLFGRAATSS